MGQCGSMSSLEGGRLLNLVLRAGWRGGSDGLNGVDGNTALRDVVFAHAGGGFDISGGIRVGAER